MCLISPCPRMPLPFRRPPSVPIDIKSPVSPFRAFALSRAYAGLFVCSSGSGEDNVEGNKGASARQILLLWQSHRFACLGWVSSRPSCPRQAPAGPGEAVPAAGCHAVDRRLPAGTALFLIRAACSRPAAGRGNGPQPHSSEELGVGQGDPPEGQAKSIPLTRVPPCPGKALVCRPPAHAPCKITAGRVPPARAGAAVASPGEAVCRLGCAPLPVLRTPHRCGEGLGAHAAAPVPFLLPYQRRPRGVAAPAGALGAV